MKQVVQQELVISIQKLSAHYPGQLTAGGPTWAGGSNHRSSTILWFCASVTPVLKSIHVKCTEMSPCKMQCCSSGNRLHVEKYMEQLSKCSLRCTDFMVLMSKNKEWATFFRFYLDIFAYTSSHQNRYFSPWEEKC